MAYTPFHADWKDYPDLTTPITAAFLEYLETGLVDAAADADVAAASASSAVLKTLVDAKGDLIVATAADTVAKQTAGANDTVLMADSAQSTGVKYAKVARVNLQTTTRKLQPAVITTSALSATAWPDGATNHVDLFFMVPDDYVSGDLTVKIMRRSSVSTNTAVMRKSSFRMRDGVGVSNVDVSVNIDYTPGNTNINVLSMTFAAANFQAGDSVRYRIERLGADGGDTMVGTVQFDGAWVEYTGYV